MLGKNLSVYASLMQNATKVSHKHSMSMWNMTQTGRLTLSEITTALRARWGGIYNAKIAARMKLPYFAHATNRGTPPRPGSCPLCGGQDSATHILGECTALKHLHIKRHNEIGKRIIHHVKQGALGSHYMIADVGTEQSLADDYDVHEKLIPRHLVPPYHTADGQPLGNADLHASTHSPRAADGHADNTPSRLDIAIIHEPHERVSRAKTWQDLHENTRLTAVEIGFRNDYDPDGRKYSEKMRQHRRT